jgi:hypothetical protein
MFRICFQNAAITINIDLILFHLRFAIQHVLLIAHCHMVIIKFKPLCKVIGE